MEKMTRWFLCYKGWWIIALLSVINVATAATVMCQHFLGHTIKQLFELPRILQVINNH